MRINRAWLRWSMLTFVVLTALAVGYLWMKLFVVVDPSSTPEDIVQAFRDRGYEIQDLSVNSEGTCWPAAAIVFGTHIEGEQYEVAVASCPGRFDAWRSVYLFYRFRRARDFVNTVCLSHKTLVIYVYPRDRAAVREARRIVRSLP